MNPLISMFIISSSIAQLRKSGHLSPIKQKLKKKKEEEKRKQKLDIDGPPKDIYIKKIDLLGSKLIYI